jgi:hypothetical protein
MGNFRHDTSFVKLSHNVETDFKELLLWSVGVALGRKPHIDEFWHGIRVERYPTDQKNPRYTWHGVLLEIVQPEWLVRYSVKVNGKWTDYAGDSYVVEAKTERSAKSQARRLLEERFPTRLGHKWRISYAMRREQFKN